jgi:hypothetical protein
MKKAQRNLKKKLKRAQAVDIERIRFYQWCKEHSELIPRRDPTLWVREPLWIKETYRKTKEHIKGGKALKEQKFIDEVYR